MHIISNVCHFYAHQYQALYSYVNEQEIKLYLQYFSSSLCGLGQAHSLTSHQPINHRAVPSV